MQRKCRNEAVQLTLITNRTATTPINLIKPALRKPNRIPGALDCEGIDMRPREACSLHGHQNEAERSTCKVRVLMERYWVEEEGGLIKQAVEVACLNGT
jgi:hypothetical protein